MLLSNRVGQIERNDRIVMLTASHSQRRVALPRRDGELALMT